MFFSGDPSNRRRVDLGGRSSKERDRKKLLEQARLERNKRSWMRQQNSAALIIQAINVHAAIQMPSDTLIPLEFPDNYSRCLQKCFRGRKVVKAERGDILKIFGGSDYSSKHALVNYRVERLAYACIQAVHHNRYQFKDQLLSTSLDSGSSINILLKAAVLLIDPKLPWSCRVGKVSLMETLLALVIVHTGQGQCVCPDIDLQWSFASQVLTIPFAWQIFPYLKEIYVLQGLCQHYLRNKATSTLSYEKVLHVDISAEFPGYACLLGNLLEVVGVALSRSACPCDMAIDFANVATLILEVLPPIKMSKNGIREENSGVGDDDMIINDAPAVVPLSKELEKQISNAIDPRFLLQMVCYFDMLYWR
ncbi:hypothetical protein L1987_80743 [Smallanthus sonchifolius]|uniref:Uncharacterized protein n=1 Tax=Smallanthus sonchifolius TaxID=185202 RepID=A0ACB8YP28_9ASTR|nr:hypothetical protein L1987_80743 [Smallanthus sonchifolius]